MTTPGYVVPPGRGTSAPVLRVEGLGVALPQADGSATTVLKHVDLKVASGELVVLLGPSGSGKSTLVSALLGLMPAGALVRGHAWWEGTDLVDPGARERDRLRGRVAAWLPQAPVSSMTSVLTVGHHLREKARVHHRAGEVGEAVDHALERHRVDPAWVDRLPSQLSGGQAQRVSNALALLGDPGLVLADEPTTGLDRVLAETVGDELRRLAVEEGRAVLVVTHDLDLAERIADAVVVLDAGTVGPRRSARELVEQARAARHDQADVRHDHAVVQEPDGPGAHPRGSATSTTAAGVPGPAAPRTGADVTGPAPPRTGADVTGPARPRTGADVTGPAPRQTRVDTLGLRAVGLTLTRGRGHVVRRDVDLHVRPDTTTGLMAPSGAGKTTLLRTLALLHAPASGHVEIDGRAVRGIGMRVPREVRRRIGYVPQDPRQAVDPRWTLGRVVAEPLRLVGRRAVDLPTVAGLLDAVGLDPSLAGRRADEVSGGQLQRVVLARALALRPDHLLLDEPTSMVDGATAKALVAAVHDYQHASGAGVLVASHDEGLLRTWCDRVVRW